jgi:hypothetical protein
VHVAPAGSQVTFAGQVVGCEHSRSSGLHVGKQTFGQLVGCWHAGFAGSHVVQPGSCGLQVNCCGQLVCGQAGSLKLHVGVQFGDCGLQVKFAAQIVGCWQAGSAGLHVAQPGSAASQVDCSGQLVYWQAGSLPLHVGVEQ